DLDASSEGLERRLAGVDEAKARAAEEVRAETERELEALRNELRQLRGRVEAGLVATSDEALTRQWVYQAQARTEDMARQVKAKADEQKRKRAQQPRPQQKRTEAEARKPHVIGPGDSVYVQSLGAEGDVISAPDGSGQV